MARLSPAHLLTQVELSLGMRQFSPGASPAIPCKPNASRVDEDQRRDQEICMALRQFVRVDHPKNVLASTRVIGPNHTRVPSRQVTLLAVTGIPVSLVMKRAIQYSFFRRPIIV